MPTGRKAKREEVALAPAIVRKKEAMKVLNPLSGKRPKNFGIGQDIVRESSHRFAQCPAVTGALLKVPPAMTPFTRPRTANSCPAAQACPQVRPEAKGKKETLLAHAETKAAGRGGVPTKRPRPQSRC